MIVSGIQHLVHYVRGTPQTEVFKTLTDPVTGQQIVTCEVYTLKGTVEKTPNVGTNVDKKA